MISFRIDWFDLLAVQGTLKSLLQHHSSKASILQCSAFFMVQLSYPYMTTGKTIALICNIFLIKKALAPRLNYDKQFVSDKIKMQQLAGGEASSQLLVILHPATLLILHQEMLL